MLRAARVIILRFDLTIPQKNHLYKKVNYIYDKQD